MKYVILFLTFLHWFGCNAQNKITLQKADSLKHHRLIELKPGNYVNITYLKSADFDKTKKLRKNILPQSGKILRIETDSIRIKKNLSKKISSIPVGSIYSIRKSMSPFSTYLMFASGTAGGAFLSPSISYYFIGSIQWCIPNFVISFFNFRVINRFKIVHPAYY